MEKTENNKVGQATPEQIKAWKSKHGKIFYACADNHIAYFRKPNRKELSYAMRLKDDELAMMEMILKECHVGGSEIFYQNVEFMFGVSNLVDKLIAVKSAEVGEL